MRFPLLGRAVAVAGVAVAVLLPIALIEGKISERRHRAEAVERQFATQTSGPQVIVGPLLALTCEETFTEERQVMRAGKAETVSDKRIASCPTGYFTPRELKVTGTLPVESLHRGIYPIRLYRAALEITGEIEWPAPAAWNGSIPRVWKDAWLVMAVSDARGIKQLGAPLKGGKGSTLDARFTYQSDLGEYAARKKGDSLPFAFRMQLVGTRTLSVAPVGDVTQIRLSSPWPHPSFTGSWSPDERRVSAEGFEATWRMTQHATGGQPSWERQAREGTLFQTRSSAGVSIFEPVNVYALSFRATEYGFLFVLFTFAALAMAELFAGVRLHAIQYLLVGTALAVFFLLLIALSEHIAFGHAYLIAAGACIALLTLYLRHPLRSFLHSVAFLVLFVALYATLFVLLKSEDHALLMGSVMAFVALSVAMIATRKLDWAGLSRRMLNMETPSAGSA
jgi:inner membrane protein